MDCIINYYLHHEIWKEILLIEPFPHKQIKFSKQIVIGTGYFLGHKYQAEPGR